jgi:gliding motility-associated-like protein
MIKPFMKYNFSFSFFLILFLFAIQPVKAQRYYIHDKGYRNANKVLVGSNYTGFDFKTYTPFISMQSSPEQAAAVSDSATGELLFYTGAILGSSGGTIWDKNHTVMPNGTILGGGGTTAQGSLIVPAIDSPDLYYVFSLNYQGVRPGLYYSVVDMRLNNGLGDVVPGKKDILLDDGSLSEAMVAIPGNNCDVWVVVHAFDQPVFKAYRVTAHGIDTPVVSRAGLEMTRIVDKGQYSMCFMSVSPDRKLLALNNNYTTLADNGHTLPPDWKHVSGTHLFTFDYWTGKVDNYLRVHSYSIGTGIVFSPDGKKLYTVNRDFGSPRPPTTLRQYDVSVYDSTTIANSVVDIYNAFSTHYVDLRLIDDTIFVTNGINPFIGAITNPNAPGTAITYQPGYIPLIPGQAPTSTLGRPTVYPFYDTIPTLRLDTLICDPWDSLELAVQEGYLEYIWNDGLVGTDAHTRQITEYGKYWVVSVGKCHARVDTFIVRGARLHFGLGPDTVLCNAEPMRIGANVGDVTYEWQDGLRDSFRVVRNTGTYILRVSAEGCAFSDSIGIVFTDLRQDLGPDEIYCQRAPIDLTLELYLPDGARNIWQDGSTAPSYHVQDSGTYHVIIEDDYCSFADTIEIKREFCECIMEIPSAFTPNNDGRNDTWQPIIEPGCPVHEYRLRIFDRWGKMIYMSTKPWEPWDGTINGAPAEIGVYMYDLVFRGAKKPKQYHKGDLTLIR